MCKTGHRSGSSPGTPLAKAGYDCFKSGRKKRPDKRRQVGIILVSTNCFAAGRHASGLGVSVSECAWNLRSSCAVAGEQKSDLNSIDLAPNNKDVAV
jgi:hypothetical protein